MAMYSFPFIFSSTSKIPVGFCFHLITLITARFGDSDYDCMYEKRSLLE